MLQIQACSVTGGPSGRGGQPLPNPKQPETPVPASKRTVFPGFRGQCQAVGCMNTRVLQEQESRVASNRREIVGLGRLQVSVRFPCLKQKLAREKSESSSSLHRDTQPVKGGSRK